MGAAQDIGSHVHVVDGLDGQLTVVRAGATGNQTALAGREIDLTALPRKYNTAKIAVNAFADLATGRNFSFKADFQHRSAQSGPGSTWANFGTTGRSFSYTNAATSTGAGTGVVNVVGQQAFEGEGVFRTAKRFIRARISPASANYIDTTATGASGVNEFRFKSALVVLGGADELPASG